MISKIIKAISLFILDLFETITLSAVIFLLVYLFVWQPHRIKGASMEPNFHDGELILTSKLSYKLNQPRRGDVIVFRAPLQEDRDYIKRIIGLPGDKVLVKDDRVYINNKLLSEPYLPQTTWTRDSYYLRDGQLKIVPPGTYVVMGDNRDHSSDSREWGPVPFGNIVGRVWLRYWPVSKFGLIKHYEPSLINQPRR